MLLRCASCTLLRLAQLQPALASATTPGRIITYANSYIVGWSGDVVELGTGEIHLPTISKEWPMFKNKP